MELDSSYSRLEEYDTLYELLSAPQNSHTLVVPYGQSVLEFEAYVANGEDSLIHMFPSGLNKWDNLTLNFVAMTPQRRPS